MRYNVVKYQTKLGQNCLFILREIFFWKINCYFSPTIEAPSIGNISKNVFRKNHERNVGIIFDPLGPKLTISNIFWEHIECYFCLLIVPYHARTSQKSA